MGSALVSPLLGFGVSALSTGIQSAAAYKQAQAQNQANELNAQSSLYNAKLAQMQAGIYRQYGEQEYKDTVKEYRQLQGQQAAAYAASGVSVNTGSAAAVQADTAAEGVYAAQKAKYQRELQAWQAERQADQQNFDALKYRAGAVSPGLAAATTAIGGATQMFGTYSSWIR